MHIHIALVGGQTEPIFIGIREAAKIHLHPVDEICFVYSGRSKDVAELLGKICTGKFPECKISYKEMDAYNVGLVHSGFKDYLDKFDENDTWFSSNLAGGTKIWDLVLYELLRDKPHVLLFYTGQGGARSMSNLLTREVTTYSAIIDTDLQFALHGVDAANMNAYGFNNYDDEDFKVRNQLELLWLGRTNDFSQLTVEAKQRTADKRLLSDLVHGGSVVGTIQKEMNGLFSWNRQTASGKQSVHIEFADGHVFDAESHHAFDMTSNSGWFEVMTAQILSQWPRIKNDKDARILTNVKFLDEGNDTKNEIDVIVICNGQLLFVECKTGISSGIEIDKFNSAVRKFGGSGARGILISYQKIPKNVRTTCRDNQLAYYEISPNPRQRGTKQPNDNLYNLLDKLMTEGHI